VTVGAPDTLDFILGGSVGFRLPLEIRHGVCAPAVERGYVIDDVTFPPMRVPGRDKELMSNFGRTAVPGCIARTAARMMAGVMAVGGMMARDRRG
jgi:hypothetical protein